MGIMVPPLQLLKLQAAFDLLKEIEQTLTEQGQDHPAIANWQCKPLLDKIRLVLHADDKSPQNANTGLKMKCIEATGYKGLTLDKVYNVHIQDRHYVVGIDDNGQHFHVPKARFE